MTGSVDFVFLFYEFLQFVDMFSFCFFEFMVICMLHGFYFFLQLVVHGEMSDKVVHFFFGLCVDSLYLVCRNSDPFFD